MKQDLIKMPGGGGHKRDCQIGCFASNFGRVLNAPNQSKVKAFTLAEVLITLAIIGVVSALVIPSVIRNYNDRKYNTARLKALKTFGEAGKMASINNEMNSATNARNFINNVLSKYLKITKICDAALECDFPEKIQPLNKHDDKLNSDDLNNWLALSEDNGSQRANKTSTNFNAYVTTVDGFSAKVFYNPKCFSNSHDAPWGCGGLVNANDCGNFILDDTCMNVIYDMNGAKKPNHVGEDIGVVTTFWSGIKAISVAPGIVDYEINFSAPVKTNSEASLYCSAKGNSKIQYSIPSIDEMSSIYLNRFLISVPHVNFWSGSPIVGHENRFWYVGYSGNKYSNTSNVGGAAYCVRR